MRVWQRLAPILLTAAHAAAAGDVSVSLSLKADRPGPDGRPAYSASVSCPDSRSVSSFVTLEAYFTGRAPGAGGSEEVAEGVVLGGFVFGPGKTARVSVCVSPPDEWTRSGVKCEAVALRAVAGGRVLKTAILPGRPTLAKAVKMRTVEYGGRIVRPLNPSAAGVAESDPDDSRSPSDIARAVQSAGGCVNAPFRFSIMWNEDGDQKVDFDAHAVEPSGREIFYKTFKGSRTEDGGMLDVDMIDPQGPGVENIFWCDAGLLSDGTYRLFARNFNRGRNRGLSAEVAVGGERFRYRIARGVTGDAKIADVEFRDGTPVRVRHFAPLTADEPSPSEGTGGHGG